MEEFIFSKFSGFQPAGLLKMNSFTITFEGLPKISWTPIIFQKTSWYLLHDLQWLTIVKNHPISDAASVLEIN